MRVVREAQPKVFLLENDAGLSFAGKSEGVELLLRAIEAVNRETGSDYQLGFQVLRAVDFGVP